MGKQNTYDSQTAKFISTVCNSMPEISCENMKELIENPGILKEALATVFLPQPGDELPLWEKIQLRRGFKFATGE